MSRVVRFHPQAEAELEAALVWYGDLHPELAARLLASVESSVARLAEHPALGSPRAEGVMRLPLQGFPYIIYYRDTGEALRVLAVAHSRRRPGLWRGRR